MKTILFSVIVFLLVIFDVSYSNQFYIPPMDTVIVPSSSTICSDTVYVDSSACLILGDWSCVCPGTKILGPGSVIIAIKKIYTELPGIFKLYQNYPNPFNPNTIISFDVPKTDFITIKVYDVLGRELQTLVSEKLKPGTYEVQWNGTNYPSGVYFYKLETENFSETRKLILLK